MDDFELVVTDLDADASQGAPDSPTGDDDAAPGWILTAASSQAPVLDGGLPTAGQPGPALRRRLVAVATVSACLLVALALIVSASPAESAVIGRLFPTPTPLPIGAGTLILDHYAPWGQLLVNGRAVPLSKIVVLRPGRYILDYHAAPFPPLRCRVSVPAARSDTCPLLRPGTSDSVQGFGAARVLDLRAEMDRLPSDQYAALLTVVQRELPPPSEAVVLPGEAYLAADGTVAVARERLIATFLYALNQGPSHAPPPSGPTCVPLCVQSSDLDLGSWLVDAYLVVGWRYTTPDGRVLIPYAPVAPPGAPIGDYTAIPLEVRWSGGRRAGGRCASGGWQVILLNAQDANPVCSIAAAILSWQVGGFHFDTFPAPSPAQGCAAQESSFLPTFLYQFGVVLAANADAHRFFPSLPLADARQQALAQQLIAQVNSA